MAKEKAILVDRILTHEERVDWALKNHEYFKADSHKTSDRVRVAVSILDRIGIPKYKTEIKK